MDPVVLHNTLVDLRVMVGEELDSAIEKLGKPSRDQLAAMAMQGLLASPNLSIDMLSEPSVIAEDAYRVADAMLKARGTKPVTP